MTSPTSVRAHKARGASRVGNSCKNSYGRLGANSATAAAALPTVGTQRQRAMAQALPTVSFDVAHHEIFNLSTGLKVLRRKLSANFKLTMNKDPITLERLRDALANPNSSFAGAFPVCSTQAPSLDINDDELDGIAALLEPWADL